MTAREELIRDLKLWACSPRVPVKAQLVMLEAVGALSSYVGSGDSARYRWLADKVIAPDYGDNDSNPHRKGYFIARCKGPNWIGGESLDSAIDEQIAKEAK